MFTLGKLYAPRGIIDSSKKKDCYVQVRPSICLNHFIYCYWASPADSTDTRMEFQPPKDEIIVPHGCVSIVFVINKKTKTCESLVYGTLDIPHLVNMKYDILQNFGITFYPGGIYSLLKTPLTQLKNKICTLEDVMPDTWKKLCSEIARGNTIGEMVKTSNAYFSSLIDNQFLSDSLCNMLYSIYKSKGSITIKELSQMEAVSERHIRRIFDNWVGINPKTFTRIVRFQNVIKSTIYSTNVDWVSVALEHGYYDESHFFNEFKEFYGVTPGEYLENI